MEVPHRRDSKCPIWLPAQPVDATQALNISAGGWKCVDQNGDGLALAGHRKPVGIICFQYFRGCEGLGVSGVGRTSGTEKKESTVHRLNRACPPCAKPSSLSSFNHDLCDALTAEGKSPTRNGMH